MQKDKSKCCVVNKKASTPKAPAKIEEPVSAIIEEQEEPSWCYGILSSIFGGEVAPETSETPTPKVESIKQKCPTLPVKEISCKKIPSLQKKKSNHSKKSGNICKTKSSKKYNYI